MPYLILFTILISTLSVSVSPTPYIVIISTAINAQLNIEFKTYTIPNRFSIQVSKSWFAAPGASSSDYFSFTNYKQFDVSAGPASKDMIKTEVWFLNISFEEQLQRDNQVAREQGARITKQGNLTISGKPSVRIWSEGGGWDFSNTISSYIRYSNNKTIVINSYYDSNNPTSVEIIERIHWSFRILD